MQYIAVCEGALAACFLTVALIEKKNAPGWGTGSFLIGRGKLLGVETEVH